MNKVFDTIGYIPQFYQLGDKLFTKKIGFDIVMYLGHELITEPSISKINDRITIPMTQTNIPYGSLLTYDINAKGQGGYTYQTPSGYQFESIKSEQKADLFRFFESVDAYLWKMYSSEKRPLGIQRRKSLFEIIMRIGLKKRRELRARDFLVHIYYGQYVHPENSTASVDDSVKIYQNNSCLNTDPLGGSPVIQQDCPEYLSRELRWNNDGILEDEIDKLTEFVGNECVEYGISALATHAIEIFELQKNELMNLFETGLLEDEFVIHQN